ncbi:MAG: AmmeMemoRadiSam system protein A [Bacillota bacterium]
MSVVYGGIVPHPPIMVPEVGGHEAGRVRATQEALAELGRRIAAAGPETLVIMSPHAPVFHGAIALNLAPRYRGDLANFGAPGVRCDLRVDRELGQEIRRQAAALDIPVVDLAEPGYRGRLRAPLDLDHGVVAPLYWLGEPARAYVVLSMAFLPPERLYAFGLAISRAAEALGRPTAVVASGDLSHRLTPGAPAGYDPQGEVFDAEIVRLLKQGDVSGLLTLDPELVERAGECGYRTLVMLLGAFDGYRLEVDILSYEGPFGVGYLVAALKPGAPDPGRQFLRRLEEARRESIRERRAGESYLVRLARETLESYVRGERRPDPGEIPPEFRRRAGVFVSIKKHGALRGCIGTVEPVKENIVAEVMANAISAGTRDPRFFPVEPEELDDLEYSVDVLGEPEPVTDVKELDPRRYGVIVSSGARRGLLLPDIEGVETVEQQLAIAREKAGIGPGEDITIERFEVVRYR